MTNTGLLPFVRGIDFTCNDFSEGKFPSSTRYMSGVQWLKLNKTNLTEIPEELGTLMKLEHLSLKKNNIEKLYGELTELNCLRSLNVSHNKVKSSGIPSDLFKLEDLTTLDLSNNRLNCIPEGLEKAKSLLVLNLSHNSIDSIPPALFIQLSDLLFLDLSDNQLETLPPQTRRLANLQTLILNNNPLGLFQLRQLPSLQCLEILQMRNTQRTPANIPTSLETLTSLTEIDLAQNELPKVPDALYTLPNLKRLDLSDNLITELSGAVDLWQGLRNLNLSRNKLTALPSNLCKLQSLRVLHVNDNHLDFEGIPSGIGKLSNLEVFSAANNHLEMIPEGLCRCGSLKRLNLTSNRLITLPEAVHLLPDLRLELDGNPDLILPPRPSVNPSAGSGVEFYNIDFSLQHQLRLAGAAPAPLPASEVNSVSDANARRLRLRRGRRDAAENGDAGAGLILRGMQGTRDGVPSAETPPDAPPPPDSLRPKKWDESLEKPPLDYSEFFDEDVGQTPGLSVWEIENFLPTPVEEGVHGKFYEGDCYIVLRTFYDPQGSLSWDIHFWIGEQASLDKRACAAIHAVHLRNLLGARCRTQRQEQGDEADDFMRLFPTPPMYIQGGRTASGFYTVDDTQYMVRLYRVHTNATAIHVIPVALEVGSLDPRHVFILDAGLNIYIWIGKNSKNTLRSKARLFAEKINKNERKNAAEITSLSQMEEKPDFWRELGREDGTPPEEPLKEHVQEPAEGWSWPTPRLYRVELGLGYLELPQVEDALVGSRLHRSVLQPRCVYLLDTHVDVCVWLGRRSPRLVRAAAARLAGELRRMLCRPPHARVLRACEGSEPHAFRAHFAGWDDVIPVDFTRTAESVARTGADLQQWARKQEAKADLTALFTPRQTPISESDGHRFAADWSEELEAMESFVLEGRRFVRLPDEELGIFHSADCYVFLCRYILPPQGEDADDETDDDLADSVQWVVYFWQGRMAGNMGWLTFTFGLEKKFRPLCHNLEVVRTHQQQESAKFMSHFNGKFIIKDGKRKTKRDPANGCIELYELRSNGSILCSRLIQVKADASQLNSAFCYILKVLFESKGGEEESGVNYVWLGSKATAEDIKVIEQIAEHSFNSPWLSLQVLSEGSEPENFFWAGLGGKKPYETNADFMLHTRLFRCSNERGYFTVSEKCTDFCQDDLADDDIMILDNGEQVFLWLGSRCSEVEIKLAYKSAQVYIQHMRVKQPEIPRKLFLTLKNKESKRFTKCFHGWGLHKKPPE